MSAPIRVAQVMGKMVGGGVESVIMNYYRHIDRSRFQFDFLVDEDSTLVPRDEIESLGGRVFMVPSYQKLPNYIKAIKDYCCEKQWPIVHSNLNSLSVFPLCAAKHAGIPIRIAHSHSTAGKGELARNTMKGVLKRLSNVYPTNRLACSISAGEWLFGKGSKFDLMKNAIDFNHFKYNGNRREQFRKMLNIDANTFLIGHIGRFSPQKNQLFLIRLMPDILNKKPDAKLVLAGSGPDLERCKNVARNMGLDSSVIFLGQIDDTASFYSGIDCFCFPSTYEGLGIALVEAQAAALPCFASDNVPNEAFISTESTMISLDAKNRWIDSIVSSSIPVNRGLSLNDVDKFSNWDIDEWSEWLKDYYNKALMENG